MSTDPEAAVREALAELLAADLTTLARVGLSLSPSVTGNLWSPDLGCWQQGRSTSLLEEVNPMRQASQTPDPSALLNRDEAAAYVRGSVSTLDRLTRAGKVPHYRHLGRVLYDPDDLRALVASAFVPAETTER